MSTGVLVALISAAVAVCSAVISGYVTARSVRLEHALAGRRAEQERREASEDVLRRYREPLLLAAFDLQARLCNIVEDGFGARQRVPPVTGRATSSRRDQHRPGRRRPAWSGLSACQ